MDDDVRDDAQDQEGFIRWFLVRFSTRAHFMRFIATAIVLVTLFQFLFGNEAHDALLALAGMVLGYYFKPHDKGSGHED